MIDYQFPDADDSDVPTGTGEHRSPSRRYTVRLPADLAAEFQRYLDRTRPRVKKNKAFICALENFLASEGFWQLPPSG